jgi:hypothetical protein
VKRKQTPATIPKIIPEIAMTSPATPICSRLNAARRKGCQRPRRRDSCAGIIERIAGRKNPEHSSENNPGLMGFTLPVIGRFPFGISQNFVSLFQA